MNPLSERLNALVIFTAILLANIQTCSASESKQLEILKKAYPMFIKDITNNSLTWMDGGRISITDHPRSSPTLGASKSPTLLEQLSQPDYPTNKMIQCEKYIPKSDPGRIRNESFFAKMYGENERDARNNLDTIYWMPKYFGHKYPISITRVNEVNVKLQHVSDQLELLVKNHPEFIKYLDKPSGSFFWRHIQNSTRRSPHSFGIAIDINSNYSNYWIWDTGIKENKINQSDIFPYKNRIPCEIVTIFENNGFIWGGKWQHYDTMHFEYRPELLIK